jgi:hypothetical protein
MTPTANGVAILVLLMAGVGLALSSVLHSCEAVLHSQEANSRRNCMSACFTAAQTKDTCERSCR